MWPLYILFNKSLKTEEENVSKGENSSLVKSYPHESSTNGKCSVAVLPQSHSVEVPHINQLYSWDCGLACVLMVFRTVGINSYSIQSLAELCCTNSIWTVDLAYLLHEFSISFSYYTVTLGANPNYSDETFYKEQLPKDLVRVETLFQRSLDAGLNIQCRSISEEEISLWMLSGKYIAIALVDQYKLSRSWQKDVFISDFNAKNSSYTDKQRMLDGKGRKMMTTYKGHYVIICGYDMGTDEFEIRDPASSRKHEKVSSKCLEEARKCFGTDEDLLLISLEKIGNQDSNSLQLSAKVNLDS
ncbi:guanylyl cyclase 1 isoform X2 [Ziziphus jujuba]|uniref:Guanylyl cyclase 1 isoform X2 n=1 Tax=Ziziphus jujuba TaxID=326968 RepID=A0ABM3IDS6_ZIZJJ|nr:guanylyl cyclase 1 isoform X2 [Ziziphus jujuba]